MPHSKTGRKKLPKRILALPDLEHAKTAVLNSLTSANGQRTCDRLSDAALGPAQGDCSLPILGDRLATGTRQLMLEAHLRSSCLMSPLTIGELPLDCVSHTSRFERVDDGSFHPGQSLADDGCPSASRANLVA
jgi:hypothetical protein